MNWDLISVLDADTWIEIQFTEKINRPRSILKCVNQEIKWS